MTGEPLVGVRAEGACCVIELRRPRKLNALSTALEAALGDAITGPEARRARCIVITGDARAFSTGADVTEFRGRDPQSIADYYRTTGDVYERVAALPQPTIAAIAGHCLGGGLELALACDFRVADTTAKFGLPEVSLGILPSSGGTLRLARLVGTARAKELMLLRERFDAAEADGLGLLTDLVEEGHALERALALGDRIAALPALAVEVAKQAVDTMPDASRAAGLAIERLAYGMLAQTAAAQEAAENFGKPD
jgi:enoyl-CoA hydratase/carnithine racemase